jgi:DNA-binding CsgD family transcriptional regulator
MDMNCNTPDDSEIHLPPRKNPPALSPRQEQCLLGVLELRSAKEIARDLGITAHAVEKHLRIAREKLGASTSAEAARRYASQHLGSVFPHSERSDLAEQSHREEQGQPVLGQAVRPSFVWLEDVHGALLLDHPLTPRQTLLAIFAVSMGSIIGLLLLVACAQGIRTLVSG